MISNNYYIGTDLKLMVTLTASGFDQSRDDYDILIICGNKQLSFNQDDVLEDSDHHKFIVIPTSMLAPGVLKMIVTAYVPDIDTEEGIRKEVQAIDVAVIRPTSYVVQ